MMNKKDLKSFIQEELRGNLNILIDPKKKNSFSDSRVQTWVNTVSERIIYHLDDENKE
ncbi:MAG: hypothetical protein GY936_15790 [Ignavibacteriae bacterium]|nr:hypothetical protein [Ignavibacteriota bacterium]